MIIIIYMHWIYLFCIPLLFRIRYLLFAIAFAIYSISCAFVFGSSIRDSAPFKIEICSVNFNLHAAHLSWICIDIEIMHRFCVFFFSSIFLLETIVHLMALCFTSISLLSISLLYCSGTIETMTIKLDKFYRTKYFMHSLLRSASQCVPFNLFSVRIKFDHFIGLFIIYISRTINKCQIHRHWAPRLFLLNDVCMCWYLASGKIAENWMIPILFGTLMIFACCSHRTCPFNLCANT